jgi:hypothetical protein
MVAAARKSPVNKRIESQLIRMLGALWPSEPRLQEAARLLRAHPEFDPGALLAPAHKHGVGPQVAHNAALLAPMVGDGRVDELAAAADRRWRDAQGHVRGLLTDTERFLARAAPAGIVAVGIKGIAMAPDYPEHAPREMYDVDLLILTGSVWETLRIFEELGYYAPRLRLDRHGEPLLRGAIHGITALTGLGNAKSYPLRLEMREREEPFDLHFQAFPGLGDTMLDADLAAGARRRPVGEQELLIPSVENAILIMCTHLFRHGTSKVKDLNDLQALLHGREHELDWDYLLATARRNTLEAPLHGLLRKLRQERGVELPEAWLRQSAPRGLPRLAARWMSDGVDQATTVEIGQGGLYPGRAGQAIVLREIYRKRGVAPVRALARAVSNLWRLTQDGRSYRTWSQREVRSFDEAHLVLASIAPQADGEAWLVDRIDLARAVEVAEAGGIPIRAYRTSEVVVWDVGDEGELVLTPEGVLTQASYRGEWDEVTLAGLERRAWEVCARLVDAGAMSARRVGLDEARALAPAGDPPSG